MSHRIIVAVGVSNYRVKTMQTLSSNFIGDFKTGDNIVYNLKIAQRLYECNEIYEPKVFNKPIILINTSIIEALLYDFIKKINRLTVEGVNLPDDIVEQINDKKVDKFKEIIDQVEKHGLLTFDRLDLVPSLRELNQIRNRIHIQNDKNLLEADDEIAFSSERVVLSEQVLEIVVKDMANKHSRKSKHASGHVENICLPFGEHFVDQSIT